MNGWRFDGGRGRRRILCGPGKSGKMAGLLADHRLVPRALRLRPAQRHAAPRLHQAIRPEDHLQQVRLLLIISVLNKCSLG